MAENTTLSNGRRIYSNTNEDGTELYTDKNGRVRYSNAHVVSEAPDNERIIFKHQDGKKTYDVFDELEATKKQLAAEREAHEKTKALLDRAIDQLNAITKKESN